MALKQKLALFSILGFLVLAAVTAFILFSYQRAYAGKIYRNIYFSNIDLSGKTKKQAEQILLENFRAVLGKDLTINANSKEIKAKFIDTGLAFNLRQIIDDSYQIGRDGVFLADLVHTSKTLFSKHTVTAKPQINQQKYAAFLEVAVKQLDTEPVDASLAITNGEIVSTAAAQGYIADTSRLDELIINAVEEKDELIELPLIPAPPQVQNADFQAARTDAENILAKAITFTYEEKSFRPTRVEIGNWLQFKDNNGQYYTALNESNIKAYLTKIAAGFEVKRVDRKVNGASGEVISEGVEGKYLNKDKALTDIKSQIRQAGSPVIALETQAQAPQEIKVFPNEGFVAGRFDGKYIDVDLTAQKLCRVEGPTLIECTIISSGKPSMPTPTGTFKIQNKNPRQWSRKYGLWMPYWQAFNGDYGFHELPEWPGGYKEGADHLGRPVSHGCVRLGIGAAEALYNWTDIGTAVYIHK